jgi:hypothetical protein
MDKITTTKAVFDSAPVYHNTDKQGTILLVNNQSGKNYLVIQKKMNLSIKKWVSYPNGFIHKHLDQTAM